MVSRCIIVGGLFFYDGLCGIMFVGVSTCGMSDPSHVLPLDFFLSAHCTRVVLLVSSWCSFLPSSTVLLVVFHMRLSSLVSYDKSCFVDVHAPVDSSQLLHLVASGLLAMCR